ALTSFAPTSGPAGTAVTLTGVGLSNTTSVRFNNLAATFTIASDTQVTAAVPPGATSGPIRVTTAFGSPLSATNFTVTSSAAPTISSFSPAQGGAGLSVTIYGSNFTGTSAVSFNGTAAAAFSVVGDGQLSATVPQGATSGTLSVTNSVGTE